MVLFCKVLRGFRRCYDVFQTLIYARFNTFCSKKIGWFWEKNSFLCFVEQNCAKLETINSYDWYWKSVYARSQHFDSKSFLFLQIFL